MPDPIISPDGSSFWTGTEWAPTSDSNQITNLNLQDSVIGGDVNISMNSISEIKQAVDSALITHIQPNDTAHLPGVVSPRKQVWFMGRRIWNPKGLILFISLFLSFYSVAIFAPWPALTGVLIAGYCIKKGDIRGIPVLLFNLLITIISI